MESKNLTLDTIQPSLLESGEWGEVIVSKEFFIELNDNNCLNVFELVHDKKLLILEQPYTFTGMKDIKPWESFEEASSWAETKLRKSYNIVEN